MPSRCALRSRHWRLVAVCSALLAAFASTPLAAATLLVLWDASPDPTVAGYVVYVDGAERGRTTDLSFIVESSSSAHQICVASRTAENVVGDQQTCVVWQQPIEEPPPPPPPPPPLVCVWYLTGDSYQQGDFSPPTQVRLRDFDLWLMQRKAEGWVFHSARPRNRNQTVVVLQCQGL